MRLWMKEARMKCGFTMKEAGRKLGISESYYSLIESGNRKKDIDIRLAKKIAELFGLTLEQVIMEESG